MMHLEIFTNTAEDSLQLYFCCYHEIILFQLAFLHSSDKHLKTPYGHAYLFGVDN